MQTWIIQLIRQSEDSRWKIMVVLSNPLSALGKYDTPLDSNNDITHLLVLYDVRYKWTLWELPFGMWERVLDSLIDLHILKWYFNSSVAIFDWIWK